MAISRERISGKLSVCQNFAASRAQQHISILPPITWDVGMFYLTNDNIDNDNDTEPDNHKQKHLPTIT